jgi:hypothetical protein
MQQFKGLLSLRLPAEARSVFSDAEGGAGGCGRLDTAASVDGAATVHGGWSRSMFWLLFSRTVTLECCVVLRKPCAGECSLLGAHCNMVANEIVVEASIGL